MSRIRILPDRVANQIAAGEVVERPVAVVKELVENSIDSGAKRIEVEIKRGGKSWIRVTDNGSGMVREEALLSLERHATSKIRETDDLLRITSFGFRGEALPSIASVCDFNLRTRLKDQPSGTEIRVSQGKLIDCRECGTPVGTRIEVAHLFNAVPARRKFLKTDPTETAHIIQVVRLFSLAHPHVGFSLKVDGRESVVSPPCSGLEARIAEIWGKNILNETLPFERRSGDLFFYGRLGRPPLSRSTRHDLVCIVNGRPVDSRTLQYGVMEACTGFLPKGRYPVAFLFLELDPAAVDVNVHPTKREIRFREESTVRRIVVETVMDLLLHRDTGGNPDKSGLFPSGTFEPVEPPQRAPTANADTSPSPEAPPPPESPTVASTPDPISSLPRKDAHPGILGRNPERPPGSPPPPHIAPAASKRDTGPTSKSGAPWEWIGYLGESGILFRSPRGLIVFHPRAASERVLYEKIIREYESGEVPRQSLLIPQTFEWDPLPAQCLEEHLESFREHGFEVEAFGKNFYRVSSVPAWFEPGRAEEFLRDAVGLIREGAIRPHNAGPFRTRMATLAAKSAYRRGKRLSPDEALQLVEALLQTRVPHACPAGKPTFLEYEIAEMRKRFGRDL